MNTNTTAPVATYSCKSCAAASPDGIGYYVGAAYNFPAPSASCGGFHFGDTVAI